MVIRLERMIHRLKARVLYLSFLFGVGFVMMVKKIKTIAMGAKM
jgi:hypothetical protein